MGEAKRKRTQEEERRAAEELRRREERARRNSPKGRRAYLPMEIRLRDPEKPGRELGSFHLHPDGKAYTATSPARRVRDARVIALVHARYQELHPPKTPTETASA